MIPGLSFLTGLASDVPGASSGPSNATSSASNGGLTFGNSGSSLSWQQSFFYAVVLLLAVYLVRKK